MSTKNLRRISMDGQPSIGRVMDKLVRDRMISLRQPKEIWITHYINRFKEVR